MKNITPTHIKTRTYCGPVVSDSDVTRHRLACRSGYRTLDPEEPALYRDTYARLGVPEGRLIFDIQETPEPDDRTAEGWL